MTEQATKHCPSCERDLPLSEFGYRAGKLSHLLRGNCRPCESARITERQKAPAARARRRA